MGQLVAGRRHDGELEVTVGRGAAMAGDVFDDRENAPPAMNPSATARPRATIGATVVP